MAGEFNFTLPCVAAARRSGRGDCVAKSFTIRIAAMAARFSHARELRTIGQELDKRGIDIFDLRYLDNGDYVLECADPNPPFTDLIELKYSAFDLATMNLNAARARSAGFTLVDFESMAEVLRAIGRYVEQLDGKLSRIAVPEAAAAGAMFRIEYQSRDGRYCVEELRAADIADLALRMYKRRSKISGGSGKGDSSA